MKNKLIKIAFICIGILSLISGISKGNFEAQIDMKGIWYTPDVPSTGKPTFCVEPGVQLDYTGYDKTRFDALYRSIQGTIYRGEEGWRCTSVCSMNKGPRAVTKMQYEQVAGTQLSGALAFIMANRCLSTDPIVNTWSKSRQLGVWHAGNNGMGNGIVASGTPLWDGTGTNSYFPLAAAYHNFNAKGFTKADNTGNISNIKTKVDRVTKEYTVGNFNISYTDAYPFSGISGIKMIGYNKNNQKVTENINITKIILNNGKSGQPKYYTPNNACPRGESNCGMDHEERGKKFYPAPGEDFSVVFSDPNVGLDQNDSQYVTSVAIKIEFKYVVASGTYAKYEGKKYYLDYRQNHSYGATHTHPYRVIIGTDSNGNYIYENRLANGLYCQTRAAVANYGVQDVMDVLSGSVEIRNDSLIIGGPGNLIDITMALGGEVWEDVISGKESLADGIRGGADRPLKNIKVTLYTADGKVAKLHVNPSSANIMNSVNPTLTDDKGYYLFEGLNPMQKYYVKFEYDGQIYLPTQYNKSGNNTSKGTEAVGDRTAFDARFKEIGSYPENYTSKNGGKNATYTQIELMGYTLNDKGTYDYNPNNQLIDGYLYDANGNLTNTFKEGRISAGIRNYIQSNKTFPTSLTQVIPAGDVEMRRKLQFIEDCKIQSYTRPQGGSNDLYPIPDQFVINRPTNQPFTDLATARSSTAGGVPGGATGVFPDVFYINQGLWRRQKYDAALRKDLFKVFTKINDVSHVYDYGRRGEDDKLWEINVRMSDYENYYSSGYNREVSPDDYNSFRNNLNKLGHPGKELEIYATYKITVKNQSQTVLTQIKEVIDYYDTEYTYVEAMSWISDSSKVDTNQYLKAMETASRGNITGSRAVGSSDRSTYGTNTQNNINGYKAVYITGLKDKVLATGQQAYIYLTFKVNNNGAGGPVIKDDQTGNQVGAGPKQNIAEINGYTTFYANGTQLPNGVRKGPNDIAGLIDTDSTPGNLTNNDVTSGRYEKNFEDDTDRAPGFKITVDPTKTRKVNGVVWEDKRTVASGDAMIGDGIRENNETKVAGVDVQLVEILKGSNKEYIWQTTTTNANGEYEFTGFIPGDYIVRFYYGDTVGTVKVKGNSSYSGGGLNAISYNGQDFKSTVYQKGITQNGYTDLDKRFIGYNNTDTQNATGKYGYNIALADSLRKKCVRCKRLVFS